MIVIEMLGKIIFEIQNAFWNGYNKASFECSKKTNETMREKAGKVFSFF